jgi:hypothetical protein
MKKVFFIASLAFIGLLVTTGIAFASLSSPQTSQSTATEALAAAKTNASLGCRRPSPIVSPKAKTNASLGCCRPSPNASPKAKCRGRDGRLMDLVKRSDHADFEVKVKGQWTTITYDRGKVTAFGSSSITIQRPDGQSVTESITPATKFPGKIGSNVTTSDDAIVLGENSQASLVFAWAPKTKA